MMMETNFLILMLSDFVKYLESMIILYKCIWYHLW